MTIPNTHASFKRWLTKRSKDFPPELAEKGERARPALWAWEANPKARTQSKAFIKSTVQNLTAFAEAYGKWQASKGAG